MLIFHKKVNQISCYRLPKKIKLPLFIQPLQWPKNFYHKKISKSLPQWLINIKFFSFKNNLEDPKYYLKNILFPKSFNWKINDLHLILLKLLLCVNVGMSAVEKDFVKCGTVDRKKYIKHIMLKKNNQHY